MDYKYFLILVYFLLFATSSVFSQDNMYCGENALSGITVDSEKRLVVAVYRQPVLFPDRSGIRKASIIAEERAKGEIVRYFDQWQTTSRSISETDSSEQTATRLVDEDGTATNKSITREQSLVLTQVEQSVSTGDLKGLQKIEESYNKDEEELCVAVAFSAKSNELAEKAQGWMTETSDTDASTQSNDATSAECDASTAASYHKKRKPIY